MLMLLLLVLPVTVMVAATVMLVFVLRVLVVVIVMILGARLSRHGNLFFELLLEMLWYRLRNRAYRLPLYLSALYFHLTHTTPSRSK